MPTNTYVALYTANLVGLNSASFTNIPQTYTDLVVVFSGQDAATSASGLSIGINSTYSGGLYSLTVMEGNGSSAYSSRFTSNNGMGISVSGGTNLPGNAIINFQNYSNTTTFKSILTRYNASNAFVGARVDLFRSTSAITRLDFFPYTANWAAGTSISVYGIAADTNSTPKASGGVVSQDATYWYHTFGMSGNFVPNQSFNCDYLVVAGGAGGGCGVNDGFGPGGGGAGGFRTGTGFSVTAQSYAITIGAGGTGGTVASPTGASGSSSIFSTITSAGGGGGAANAVGVSGGSGGGGSATNNGGSGNTPSTSPSQGNNGGAGYGPGPQHSGGGGGGASAVGANGTSSGGGNGGAGTASSISGTSITYAGGGGGGVRTNYTPGTGGIGGGGNGTNGDSNTAGFAGIGNTGGGGGGGGSRVSSQSGSLNGGNGGSGIVIIRYAK